jgi:hypothetical protein
MAALTRTAILQRANCLERETVICLAMALDVVLRTVKRLESQSQQIRGTSEGIITQDL